MNWTMSLTILHDDVRTLLHGCRALLAKELLKQILSKTKLVKEDESHLKFFEVQVAVHRDTFF